MVINRLGERENYCYECVTRVGNGTSFSGGCFHSDQSGASFRQHFFPFTPPTQPPSHPLSSTKMAPLANEFVRHFAVSSKGYRFCHHYLRTAVK